MRYLDAHPGRDHGLGVFVSWRVCFVLFRVGGTTLFSRKERKKDDSGPWNFFFFNTFILGFRIKNLLSFII